MLPFWWWNEASRKKSCVLCTPLAPCDGILIGLGQFWAGWQFHWRYSRRHSGAIRPTRRLSLVCCSVIIGAGRPPRASTDVFIAVTDSEALGARVINTLIEASGRAGRACVPAQNRQRPLPRWWCYCTKLVDERQFNKRRRRRRHVRANNDAARHELFASNSTIPGCCSRSPTDTCWCRQAGFVDSRISPSSPPPVSPLSRIHIGCSILNYCDAPPHRCKVGVIIISGLTNRYCTRLQRNGPKQSALTKS